MAIKNIVFDFEGVFIKWVPFNVFGKHVKSEIEMERILEEINHPQISQDSDLGVNTFSYFIQETIKKFPHYKDALSDYDTNWMDVITEIPGTLQLAKNLKKKGYKVYGLSNFSLDKTPEVQSKYDFCEHLDGYIVSAFVKAIKPDAAIYNMLCEKYNFKAEESVFFDDRQINIDGAKAVGMKGFVFTTPQKAQQDLLTLGIKA
ncbi:MAG: HAD family phosphatase [Elusimicrobiota bacterium]|jgi:HAD superfamily hydrolase (TIGR01509 family)|nr:HAD family phosphatase [Elusimicrobiota bacterium]